MTERAGTRYAIGGVEDGSIGCAVRCGTAGGMGWGMEGNTTAVCVLPIITRMAYHGVGKIRVDKAPTSD